MPASCPSGVLCADDGLIWALWLSYLGDRHGSADVEFYNGLPTPYLKPLIDTLRKGEKPNLRILGCEFHSIELSSARTRGVSDEWIKKVEEASEDRHAFFMVRRVDAELAKKKRLLKEGISRKITSLTVGDIVLSCNGKIVTRMYDLNVQYAAESVDLVSLALNMSLRIASGEKGS
jgi:pro-apoptotic serine protease NMA111